MVEHEKLRSRLKNVGRNVTEYRMTVQEAKDLLKEFDDTVKDLTPKQEIEETQVIHVVTNILDGGAFQ